LIVQYLIAGKVGKIKAKSFLVLQPFGLGHDHHSVLVRNTSVLKKEPDGKEILSSICFKENFAKPNFSFMKIKIILILE
jgi:hypothetical protein